MKRHAISFNAPILLICGLSALITGTSPNQAFGLACPNNGYHTGCWKYREASGCGAPGDGGSGSGYLPEEAANIVAGDNPADWASGCSGCGPVAHGLSQYWISEPFLNLRLEDSPIGYIPATGPKVFFQLSYRQRGAVPEENYFSVGTNWSCSFRSYVLAISGGVRLHYTGAGFLDYEDGVPHFRDGSVMHIQTPGASYVLVRPNGGMDIFESAFTTESDQVLYFLTQRVDPAGNALTFNYANNNGVLELTSVTDADGKITTLYYENGSFPNRITKVVDPFSRTNRLTYDHQGYLTNITDVEGLSSGFIYDSGTASHRGWITNMTTPYGVTSFRFGGTDLNNDEFQSSGINRFAEVTLPTGGKELYLFRNDCSSFMSYNEATKPSASPFSDTFDDATQANNNSFYWSPLQYAQLWMSDPDQFVATNYVAARMRHWLVDDPMNYDVCDVLSFERAPSQDGATPGQYTWYDYPNKASGEQYTGSSRMPSLIARTLPDTTTRLAHLTRNSIGAVTNRVESYTKLDSSWGLRTNRYVYESNEMDLKLHIGPNNEQVVSNHVNTTYHQRLASYDALFQETLFTYNAARQLIKVVRPTGLTTTNIFLASADGVVRLEKTIDLEIGRSNSFTYAKGLVDSHTDARGLTITNYWDNLQRLRGMRFPDGTTTSNVYTVLDITAVKDRLGNWSYAGYNGIRQKIAETNANGVITRYDYCDCGALMSVTNAWNTAVQFVTQFGYDKSGNRVFTYLPEATITNWFDALGRVIATGDGAANTWFYYNNQGLLTNTTTANGARQITVYDIEDRPIWVTDANSVTITNTYDDLGRLRTRTYPDTGVEAFGYSARGLTAYTNQLGHTNFFAYDEAGRKQFETNANWELIRYTNSPAGDLLALVDGKNQVTKWKYDDYGRVTNKLDQAGTEILRYWYDANSRLTHRWSLEKANTYYSYDPVGNLTNINYLLSPDISFGYDALNRVTNMVDAVGTTLYSYTLGGQLWTEDGPWSDDTVTNTYINRLRVGMDLKQPTGAWTNQFTYDATRRLTNVTSPAGSFGYVLASGAPSTLTVRLGLPNTSYITNVYDVNARLLSTALKNSSSSILNSHSYSYNPGNQRTQQSFSSGSTYDYSYDNFGQLKVADSATASEDRGYTYDAAWNLNYRTNNGALSAFNVNVLNELTNSTPGGNSAYDDNGNLIITHANGWTFAYDDENQLIEVQRPVGFHTYLTTFAYDGRLRLRILREYRWVPDNTEDSIVTPPGEGQEQSLNEGGEGGAQLNSSPGGSGSWLLLSETRYIYDGMRVIQERDGSNVPTVSYTRGSDLSGKLQRAGGIGGLLARSHGYSSGNWSTHNFYHADGSGNVTYLVNSSQTLAASYRYDPYGNLISSSGTLASANTYRFSSKMIHDSSGFYYYGYRWYSPNLQRWLNRDPLQERGSINLFAFVGNNPKRFMDPFGYSLLDLNPDWPLGSGSDWPLGFPTFPGLDPDQPGDLSDLDIDAPPFELGALTDPPPCPLSFSPPSYPPLTPFEPADRPGALIDPTDPPPPWGIGGIPPMPPWLPFPRVFYPSNQNVRVIIWTFPDQPPEDPNPAMGIFFKIRTR